MEHTPPPRSDIPTSSLGSAATATSHYEDPPRQSTGKVIRAGLLGSLVEFYDFGIYGYMAVFIGVNFFPQTDATAALLATFAAFAVAFLVRIPGGIFFGHIGDKYGRKRALTWTIFLMTAATVLIGLLPTFATVGLWAAAILVLTRCIQGFAAGGEVGGAAAFVSENAPPRWRAFQTQFVNVGVYLGSLMASMVAFGLTSTIGREALAEWAWRLPFFFSLVIGLLGLWIRNSLDETVEFKKLTEAAEADVVKVPIAELFRTSKRQVIVIIGLGAMITGGYYVSTVYAATYLQVAGGHDAQFAFASTSVAITSGILALSTSGFLGDLIGRKPVLVTSSVVSIVLGFPLFALMEHGAPAVAMLAQSALVVLVSLINGVSMATYAEMLRARMRYTGIAFCNNVSNTALGGTAPFIATALIAWSGANSAPAAFFVFCALLTGTAALFVRESKGLQLLL